MILYLKAKKIKGLDHFCNEEKLKSLGLLNIEKRNLSGMT